MIEPLPHQRIAVCDHILHQNHLRFLLADDADMGKTIMTGLYIREMHTRKLLSRVLVVPSAGLVGNWEHEMRVGHWAKYALFLSNHGITTAKDLKYADEKWVRRHPTVVVDRIVFELRGILRMPLECEPK